LFYGSERNPGSTPDQDEDSVVAVLAGENVLGGIVKCSESGSSEGVEVNWCVNSCLVSTWSVGVVEIRVAAFGIEDREADG